MYVTCLEEQSFCHALRKNLKFKLLYFQNKECYRAVNKQADGNLDFLICDEEKNPKLFLVMNFSFLLRHVKTNNTLFSRTTPCGQFSDYPGHFECVALKDCTKDITGHLASLKLSTDEGTGLN